MGRSTPPPPAASCSQQVLLSEEAAGAPATAGVGVGTARPAPPDPDPGHRPPLAAEEVGRAGPVPEEAGSWPWDGRPATRPAPRGPEGQRSLGSRARHVAISHTGGFRCVSWHSANVTFVQRREVSSGVGGDTGVPESWLGAYSGAAPLEFTRGRLFQPPLPSPMPTRGTEPPGWHSPAALDEPGPCWRKP